METKLFTPVTIGPVTLRNRSIRSAAFESMCPGHKPSEKLYNYHTSVARGGIGMTTVAYAAVCKSGLSFDSQLLMGAGTTGFTITLNNCVKDGVAVTADNVQSLLLDMTGGDGTNLRGCTIIVNGTTVTLS